MWTACWSCVFNARASPAEASRRVQKDPAYVRRRIPFTAAHQRRAGRFRLRAKRFGETRRSLGGGGWTRRRLDGFFFVFFSAVLAPARHDAECAHLAVQIAALHAARFGRARDVSLLKR